MVIPRPKSLKYDFESMKKESYIKAKSYKNAVSISNCGYKRGFEMCIRTVGDEIRVYLVGKR